MILKMRHFKIENGKATIDKDGEFLHINDIVLLIDEVRRGLQNMIAALSNNDSDWSKNSKYDYEQRIKMLDEMKRRIEIEE